MSTKYVSQELDRLTRGLEQRVGTWETFLKAIGAAWIKTDRQVDETWQNPSQSMDIMRAEEEVGELGMFIGGIPLSQLQIAFVDPLSSGLMTIGYELIWKALGKRGPFRPEPPYETAVGSFRYIDEHPIKSLRQIIKELRRLIQYLDSGPSLSISEVGQVISRMLLSPAFYPPPAGPDAGLAMSMEWAIWQHFWPGYVDKFDELDDGFQELEMAKKITRLLERMKAIGWDGVAANFSDKKNVLPQLKAWCEREGRSALKIEVRFPPAVIQYVDYFNAGIPMKTFYKTPRMSWSDARL